MHKHNDAGTNRPVPQVRLVCDCECRHGQRAFISVTSK